MRFNNTRRGERQCNRAADLLNSNRFLRRYESTLYTNNCGSPERILGCTLNLRGLEWVRRYKFNYGAHLVYKSIDFVPTNITCVDQSLRPSSMVYNANFQNMLD